MVLEPCDDARHVNPRRRPADHDEIGKGSPMRNVAPSGSLDPAEVLKAFEMVDEPGDQDRRGRVGRT
jgi:hypothetical protein